MITNKSYKDLKEYWDFQRKKEYNREMVFNMAESFEGRVYNDFGMVNLEDMKNLQNTDLILYTNQHETISDFFKNHK